LSTQSSDSKNKNLPQNEWDDEDLMKSYVQGNYQAYEILYSRHKSRVYSYLHKRLKNRELVDELFQNIFLKVHKSRNLYSSKFKFTQWLYTISRNELTDNFRKSNRAEFIKFDESYQSQTTVNDDQENESTIDFSEHSNLSAKEKSAIELRYIEDKEFKEISELLDTSQSNARKLISRAIKKIKVNLAGGDNHG